MKRWWAAYLLLGAAGFLVHLHLARGGGAEPGAAFILVHVGLAFGVYLAALRAARRLGEAGRRAALFWAFTVAVAVLGVHLTSPFLVSPEVQRPRS